MKAREIIPEWPRGKSTLPDMTPRRYEYKEYCWEWWYRKDQRRMFDWWVSRYRTPESEYMVDEAGRETPIRVPKRGFKLAGV